MALFFTPPASIRRLTGTLRALASVVLLALAVLQLPTSALAQASTDPGGNGSTTPALITQVTPAAPTRVPTAPAARTRVPTVAPATPTTPVAPTTRTRVPTAPTTRERVPTAPATRTRVPTVAPATPTTPVAPAARTRTTPVAPALPAGPAAPTLPPLDTEHEICRQDDLIAAVEAGRTSGTITLDGKCRYQLTRPGHDFSGGTGVFAWDATRIEGNGAIIERDPKAQTFRLLAVQGKAGITIENLTLRGGSVTGDGGALYANQPLTLRNVTFENNTATEAGGAVIGFGSHIVVENGRFIANRAERGGAIYSNTATTVTNSVFAQNHATSLEGAAVFVNRQATVSIVACTITDNTGNTGTAIESWAKSLSVQSTIIAWHAIGITSYEAGAKEDYNLFTDSGADVVARNGAEIQRGGHSLTTSDPRFVDPDRLDYAIDRYSPAADKGAPGLAPGNDITGAPRPFAGTKPDIGAWEVQDQAGPARTIEKTGPYMLAPNLVAQFTLSVRNDGARPAAGISIDDLLPPGATYVDGSASDGGSLAGGRLSWAIGTLNPGERRSVNYRATATQTLVSRDYGVASTAEPAAGLRGRVVETPMKPNLLTDPQFFPRPDGFSFYNYSDSLLSDISDKDLQWIFGDAACKPGTSAASCVLRANVQQWRTDAIAGNKNGHCAGMAMTSLDIFANPKLTPATLQPRAATAFDIDKANARNRIGIYAATQVLRPRNWSTLEANGTPRDPARREVRSGQRVSSPIEILSTLIENLKDPNAGDRYRLGFSLPRNGGKGHTVVPFAVEKIAGDNYLIYIYENNRPNNFSLAIKVNSKTGAWSYVAQTNPSQPMEGYSGDGSEDNFNLAGWRWSTSFPMCVPGDDCSAPAGGEVASVGSVGGPAVSVALMGEGYPLVTRSDGKRAGFDPATGAWISEIEGAQALEVSYGLSANVPPVIQIPYAPGLTYSVSVAGSHPASGAPVPASLSISGPDFAASVSGLTLWEATDPDGAPAASGQPAVTLGVDPDNDRLSLRSNDGRPQAVVLGLAISQAEGSDFTFNLGGVALAGDQVGFGFDAASQSVIVEDDNGSESIYGLEILRINPDGTTDSFKGEVSDAGGPGIGLSLGADWTGSDVPLAFAISGGTLLMPAVQTQAPAQDGSIVLQSMNYTDRYLAVSEDGTRVELVPVTAASAPALLLRSRFLATPMPDIDEDVVYLMVNDGSGRYLVATREGVTLQSDGGGGMAAFFRVVTGLDGQGVSFVSLEEPGSYLRHSGFVLRLDPADGSPLFDQDATFLPGGAVAQ